MVGLEEFRRVANQVSNWGRWGDDDELGTLNFIDNNVIREAARLAKTGKVFPLGVDFNSAGPQVEGGLRGNPVHLMTLDGGDSVDYVGQNLGWAGNPFAQGIAALFDNPIKMQANDDYIMMALQAATQWDALCHVYYEDKLYNGFPATSVTSSGAANLGIEKTDVKGIVSRGVLLDACRHRDVEYLDAGSPVTEIELQQMVDSQGVEVRTGDILLVRTGWWGEFRRLRSPMFASSGLSWRCVPWLHEKQIAAIAADNLAVESADPGQPEVEGVSLPLHCLCLRDMGLMLGEMWFLDDLAADCAADGIYEFQLIAPPLRVTGAVGSPLNPIAIK